MNIDALQAQLEALTSMVERLPAEVFRATGSQASGSVGEHVRHSLDHTRALLAIGETEAFTYDARLRGTSVETDPIAAASEIAAVSRRLERLRGFPPDKPVRLSVLAEPGRAPAEVRSTVGREIAFVVQHTIHHAALIALLLERRGISTPARFGYAPSTPARN